MSDRNIDSPWPEEIRLFKAAGRLEIDFKDGRKFVYPAEYLRVESPSAELQGHSGQKTILGGRRYVKIVELEEVGNYAIRLRFDDNHDTGIYSWSYLYQLGADHDKTWQRYLDALAEKRLSRDP